MRETKLVYRRMSQKQLNYQIGALKRKKKGLRKYTGWDALAAAIVKSAVSEYKSLDTGRFVLEDIRAFFRSEWFEMLSDLDGEALIERLDRYRKRKLERRNNERDLNKRRLQDNATRREPRHHDL